MDKLEWKRKLNVVLVSVPFAFAPISLLSQDLVPNAQNKGHASSKLTCFEVLHSPPIEVLSGGNLAELYKVQFSELLVGKVCEDDELLSFFSIRGWKLFAAMELRLGRTSRARSSANYMVSFCRPRSVAWRWFSGCLSKVVFLMRDRKIVQIKVFNPK